MKRIEPNDTTSAIIGAAIEVHRHLGPGFLEATYERAMMIELARRGLAVERQVPFQVLYKGEAVVSCRARRPQSPVRTKP